MSNNQAALNMAANVEAKEVLFADTDTYTDWLYAQCLGSKPAHTRLGYIPKSNESFARFVESLDVPQLVALQLYPAPRECFAASQRLRDLYEAAQGDYIERLSIEAAEVMA